jgi:hypothetical protein
MIAKRGASSPSPFPQGRIIKREETAKGYCKYMKIGYIEEIFPLWEKQFGAQPMLLYRVIGNILRYQGAKK